MDPSKPETFNHRTERLSTGRTYHFVDQIPDGYELQKNITLVLVHGFPDLWFGWRYQINPWVKAGYRVVAPDMLGYGGTDKPKDFTEYTYKKLSADLAAILDLIGVQKAVIVGHDWGSLIAGRFALWHPDRALALIHLSVPFVAPSSMDISLEQFVALFPDFGYHLYFADEASTKEIEANKTTFFRIVFLLTAISTVGPKILTEGALRPFIVGEAQFDQQAPSILSDEDANYVLPQFETMHGPLSYYRTFKLNFEEESAGNIPNQLSSDLPVMFIRGYQDASSQPLSVEGMRLLVPHTKFVTVQAGHWLMIETKKEVVDEVLAWLNELDLESRL